MGVPIGKSECNLYFNGHKYHFNKFQLVVVLNGFLANLFGLALGKHHDSALLAEL